MSFRIFFRGLISHVHVDSSTVSRAVLVNAKHHEPTLIVKKAAFHSKNGVLPSETVLANGDRLYDLTEWDIHVQGVANTRTVRTQSFLDHVPSLTKVLVDSDSTKKKVKTSVHQKKHITNTTFSYVDYEDGTIEAIECYTDAVEFDNPQTDDPECVVEVTMYSVELSGNVTLVLTKNNDTGTIVIMPNSGVSVSNRAGKGNHFKEYRKITDASGIRVPNPKGGRICVDCIPRDDEDHDHEGADRRTSMIAKDLDKTARKAAGTVECTQSGYP